MLCVGGTGAPDGSPAKPLWRLHEAVEVMAAAYCGTLSLEYKHLQQQEEMAWLEQAFEARAPLASSQKRQVGGAAGVSWGVGLLRQQGNGCLRASPCFHAD
jgi:hypothetical protein